MLTSKKLCFANNELKNKTQVLKEISLNAKLNNYIEDDSILLKAFQEREAEFSTGMGNGIAIPHAAIDGIKEPFVSVLRTENVKWESIDNKPIDTVIAIVVPKDGRKDHLKILSELSKKLVNKEVIKIFKKSSFANLVDSINNIDISEKETKQNVKSDKLIIGITACPTGIAHTYMAQQAIVDAAKKLKYNVKVETQGAGGLEDELTLAEIQKADAIIISSGIKLEKMERFNGFENKIYKSPLKQTISNGTEVVKEAIKLGEAFNSNDNNLLKATQQSNIALQEKQSKFSELLGHLMSGIGAMLPVIIVAGLFMGLTSIINMAYYFDTGYSTWDWGYVSQQSIIMQMMYFITQMGNVVMNFMYPFFAMYIAYSIAGKMALVPGFLGGAMASGLASILWGDNAVNFVMQGSFVHLLYPNNPDNIVSSGFIGALLIGFLVGYVTKFVNTRIYVTPNWIGIKTLMIVPLLVGMFTIFTMMFVISPAFDWINFGFSKLFLAAGSSAGWLYNYLIGSGMAVDMGGPINKASLSVSWGMFTPAWNEVLRIVDATPSGSLPSGSDWDAAVQNLKTFNLSSQFMGIIVPPMGIGMAAVFGNRVTKRSLFTNEEQAMGGTALFLSTVGISEGGLPFLIKEPGKVIPSTIIGTCVAVTICMLTGAMQTTSNTALWGTFFIGTTTMSFPGFAPVLVQILGYGGGILIGALTTATIYILILSMDDFKENKKAKIYSINDIESAKNEKQIKMINTTKESIQKLTNILEEKAKELGIEIDNSKLSSKVSKSDLENSNLSLAKLKNEIFNEAKIYAKAQNIFRLNEIKISTLNKKKKFLEEAKKDQTKVDKRINELKAINKECQDIIKIERKVIEKFLLSKKVILENYGRKIKQ